MRLSEEQLMIIRKARDRVECGDSYWICKAIAMVLNNLEMEGVLSTFQAAQLNSQISIGIRKGIDNMITLGGFLSRTCPPIKLASERDTERDCREYKEFSHLMRLARLAWLDWIIHTGEIKPESVKGE
jgi:hypothetical protein